MGTSELPVHSPSRALQSASAAGFVTTVLIVVLVLAVPTLALGLTITAPGNSGVRIAQCNDFATHELNNPWDMSDSADVVTLIPKVDYDGFSALSFANGVFSAVAADTHPFFHLLSAPIPSSQPATGQRGYDHPIDPTIYDTVTMRIYSGSESGGQELRVLWNHGWGYAPNFTISKAAQFELKPGWNTYTIPLKQVVLQGDEGTPKAWDAAPVTGFRIGFVTQVGTPIKVDWVLLYGAAGCGSTQVTVDAPSAPQLGFYNLYLDDDTDPFNGYVRAIATASPSRGAAQLPLSATALFPGSYVVHGFASTEYATLYRHNPWDMSEWRDVLAAGGVSSGRFEDGKFKGTVNGSALVYLDIPAGGIPAGNFSKLSFKLTQSAATTIYVYWNGGMRALVPAQADPDGDGVYHIDLAQGAGWSGTVTQLMISPADRSGVSFELDFVVLSGDTFYTAVPTPTLVRATGPVQINAAPLGAVLQPDAVGGEAIYGWNMASTADVPLVENLSKAEILPHNIVSAEVGDFFSGVNINGDDDPINWSRFFTINPASIDTNVYHNLTYRLLVEGEVDLVLGSVARVYWTRNQLASYGQSQDIVVYGGWNSYTVDLKDILLEDGSDTWNGTVDSFRVDSHEFTAARPYHFDYIHLRADDRANRSFLIAFTLNDSDDGAGALSVTLGYSATASCSAQTVLTQYTAGADALAQGAYLWNTTGVPEGRYWICLTLSDGLNSVQRRSTGVVEVTRGWGDDAAPVLAAVAPADGVRFDEVVQVKGYALDAVQLAELRILIDGALATVLYPQRFDPLARQSYPEWADSSNAGFNAILDTTALAPGVHTLELRASDTAGNTTVMTRSIVKEPGVAPTIVPDATPDGVVQGISGTKPALRTPAISRIRSTGTGGISVALSNLTPSCTSTLYASTSPTAAAVVVASRQVAAEQASAGLTFQAARISPLKGALYLHVATSCVGGTSAESARRSVRIRNSRVSKPIAFAALLKQLQRRGRLV
jgi:hypothetical protein